MTRANLTVNGEFFHTNSDGMDGDEIKAVIQDYIDTAKRKLKNPQDIAEWVLNALFRDADDYYNWIQVGETSYTSYEYSAHIDANGELTFKQLKGAEHNV